jgi:hypothetical protein
MLKLNIETDEDLIIECNIPNGWDEVTVGTYEKLMDLKQDGTNLSMYIQILSVLSGLDKDVIEDISAVDFQKITDAISFTQTQIENETLVDHIELNGEKYYLKKDFEDLTLGEQASIEILMNKYDGKLEKAIKELLCIFLRKKKENGKLEKFKNSMMDRAESFNDVIIGEVYQLFLFFSTGKTS